MAGKVLITGGRGFLGQHLCRAFVQREWEVHATTRAVQEGDGQSPVEYHEGDMVDAAFAGRVLHRVQPDIVFHLAGSVGAGTALDLVLPTFHSHVTSAVNLMTHAATAGGPRIVLSGSLLEACKEVPASPYAAAKTVSTMYGRMFYLLYDAPVVVARPFMTFGPGQRFEKVLPYCIRCFAADDSPVLSSGEWKADWIFVSDVIDGFVRAGTAPGVEGCVFDFGRGELLSLRSIVGRIARLMGARVEPRFGARSDRPGEPERVADLELARKGLGWSPKVSLDDGLMQTIAAYTRGNG
ncbi:NAD-dependent epimerase/dehydratase family protein [Lentisalinibacter salinarum]|uniref:NAD-dependent epimerase/dehydratase family protein n=1 Tax=Lentisalinibacter salinarum TaxID=2992239 RepID=UPI00386BA3BF